MDERKVSSDEITEFLSNCRKEAREKFGEKTVCLFGIITRKNDSVVEAQTSIAGTPTHLAHIIRGVLMDSSEIEQALSVMRMEDFSNDEKIPKEIRSALAAMEAPFKSRKADPRKGDCKGCPDEQKCKDEKDLKEAKDCGQIM